MYLEELKNFMLSEVVVSLTEQLVVAIGDLQRVTHFIYSV
jgi:hypothetical protein